MHDQQRRPHGRRVAAHVQRRPREAEPPLDPLLHQLARAPSEAERFQNRVRLEHQVRRRRDEDRGVSAEAFVERAGRRDRPDRVRHDAAHGPERAIDRLDRREERDDRGARLRRGAMPGRVERDHRAAARHQRLDEARQLRPAAAPAVDEQDDGTVAPRPHADGRAAHLHDRPPRAGQRRCLVLRRAMTRRRQEDALGHARRERRRQHAQRRKGRAHEPRGERQAR